MFVCMYMNVPCIHTYIAYTCMPCEFCICNVSFCGAGDGLVLTQECFITRHAYTHTYIYTHAHAGSVSFCGAEDGFVLTWVLDIANVNMDMRGQCVNRSALACAE